ncbi:hypothetical protein [Sebaldella sp. S0638]|uniref:hypothetical protein n=1 Tax=Sebaldella sp. S0638 TaxID=2957809 RepID=UPI00209CE423|nr:hypothetical protein [Sebaldella sp. S0638]MCP1225088.1 hypothetical protein [Sebaldella sp. S0638]
MIKFNVRFQFNFTNIINKNVKSISKQAHSYFDDRIKNIDDFISERQDWFNNLNFDFDLNKNIKAFSKHASSYFDDSLSFINEKFENSNIKILSKQAYSYFDERVKNIDLIISEKQNWLSQKTNKITDLIKKNHVLGNRKIILIENKHAGYILEKLDNFHFVNRSDFPVFFLIKFIRRLLELAKLAILMSLSKKNLYSFEVTQIKIVRAPPFI